MHPLLAEAQQLDAQARAHKRAAQRHRDSAKACRIKEAELREQCARLGIEVTDPPSTTSAGDLHGRPGPQPRYPR